MNQEDKKTPCTRSHQGNLWPKYGWISERSKGLGHNTFIYKKLDSDETVEVSAVTSDENDSNTKFLDIRCVGPLGDFVKKIENSRWNNLI